MHRLEQGAISATAPVVEEEKPVRRERLFRCAQFVLWRISGESPFTVGADDMPRVLVCIGGHGKLESAARIILSQRGHVLLPAAVGTCLCRPDGAVTLLEIALPEGTSDPMKKLIVFDLDGTLAESKSSLDDEMAALLRHAPGRREGGDHLRRRLAAVPEAGPRQSSAGDHLANLSLLPTCGTKFYRYDGDWKKIYSEDFTANEKEKIIGALQQAVDASGFAADKVWGETIEDRDSQITYSALGQHAPMEEKKKWDPDFAKRKTMKAQPRSVDPRVFRPPRRHDFHRRHQARHRQGLRHQKTPRHAGRRHRRR